MKKIPTLFKRMFSEDGSFDRLLPEYFSEFSPVIEGKCSPTLKLDGTACMIKDNELWVRYDAKNGKPIPNGAIQCGEPDPNTGSNPCWVKAGNKKEYKWQIKAFENTAKQFPNIQLCDGTYECIGKHFQTNPYGLKTDILVLHGFIGLELDDFSFEGIKKWLSNHNEEGIVFWLHGEPLCKVKTSDYGLNNWKKHDPEKTMIRELITEDGMFKEDCFKFLSAYFQYKNMLEGKTNE